MDWAPPGGRPRGWRRVVPETAVFEDFADDLALPSFDEGDDLHGPAAAGTAQRVGVVDALDEHGPVSATPGVEPG